MWFIEYAPIIGAFFAIPQFLPQIRRIVRTGDTAGVSWTWAAMTCASNAGWFAYFFLSSYWTALVPTSCASVLAGVLALVLARRGRASAGTAVVASAWAGALVLSLVVGGVVALGSLLTVAFLLQVTPSLLTAYRTPDPSGISRGTWLLVLGELACWFAYGLNRGDGRLIVLGVTGVTASLLMLARTLGPGTATSSSDVLPAGVRGA